MAKLKEFKFGFGLSQAVGPNNWIKAYSEVTIEIEGETIEDQEVIKAQAREMVTEEVNRQLKEFTV